MHNNLTNIKKEFKMKFNIFLYRLCLNSHIILFWLFWGYFLALIILHIFDIKFGTIVINLFFLLLGMWIGSAIALFAIRYMKYTMQKKNE